MNPRRGARHTLQGALLIAVLATCRASDADDEAFERDIRPVLAGTCFRCHGDQKASGGLRVDSRTALLNGGESGPAVVPGSPAESLLLKALRRDDGVSAMPPDKPVPAPVAAAFEAWIRAGAPWPESTPAFAGGRHWAFEPLSAAAPPAAIDADCGRNPVDLFVEARLRERGLTPLGRPDKRTLIRRATFDLHGLPPDPDDVAAFLADERPDAFARLIDRLLASPRYGEKWGRYWLDIVRYADTAGETADFPAPHAWRYRNYVIDAFNRDTPYDEFLREQVAGDLLARQLPADAPPERYARLVTATGYLAIARRFGFDIEKDKHLTVDDTVDTLGRSVLGLALGCARCHDHKYDPIPAADYYALYGIFESTRYPFPGCEKVKTPRDLVPLVPQALWDREVAPFRERLAAADAAIKDLTDRQTTVSQRIREAAAAALHVLSRGEIDRGGRAELASAGGGQIPPVAVRPGEMLQLSVDPRANHGADSTLVEWEIREVGGEGRRWNLARDVMDDLLAGNPHADGYGNAATWCFLDARQGSKLLPEGVRALSGKEGLNVWRSGDVPSVWVNATDAPIPVWTTLPPRSLFVHPAPDGAVAVAWLSPIAGTVEITGRVADAHPEGGDGIGWRIEHVAADLATPVRELADLAAQLGRAQAARAELAAREPRADLAYAVAEGSPHDAEIQLRGDPESRGPVVPRRFLTALGGQPLRDPSASGRLELADWLTSPENPLAARVMVNRVWQHHFGRGIVRTPNDFGTRGEPPTHPELLDHLARTFVERGWSIKELHRLIMSSDAYQRSSVAPEPSDTAAPAAANETVDPDNAWLWRFDRRRLTAEEIRDALLLASGGLDPTPGGPHPFPAEGTWGFTQHNPFSAVYDTNRRSVYLMTQRIKRHPFLGLFDGADTAASTADRFATTVPTQALFFLNDPFVHEVSQRLADRLAALPDDRARLERVVPLLFGRPPDAADHAAAAEFLARYEPSLADLPADRRHVAAWAAWVRVLMSSNEFLHVD